MVTESTGRRERLSTDTEASAGGVMSTETMAAARERQARMMRRINVPMRAVLGLPFKTPLSTRLMLVFYTGPKTELKYRQPVSYVRDGDTLLTPGGGKWKLNLRDVSRSGCDSRDARSRPDPSSSAMPTMSIACSVT
jgi:hypothetical protein